MTQTYEITTYDGSQEFLVIPPNTESITYDLNIREDDTDIEIWVQQTVWDVSDDSRIPTKINTQTWLRALSVTKLG